MSYTSNVAPVKAARSLGVLLIFTERRVQHYRGKLSGTTNIVKTAEYRGRLAELTASLVALEEIARRAPALARIGKAGD